MSEQRCRRWPERCCADRAPARGGVITYQSVKICISPCRRCVRENMVLLGKCYIMECKSRGIHCVLKSWTEGLKCIKMPLRGSGRRLICRYRFYSMRFLSVLRRKITPPVVRELRVRFHTMHQRFSLATALIIGPAIFLPALIAFDCRV